NSSIHDLYLEARFTNSTKNKWGGYGINFVNAQNCHVYNIWGKGWTQLIGMGSDIPPETPSNHLCSAKYLHVLEPDLVRTYYSIG
ncbi:phage tail protein, partial [Acinetobacter baumannii]|nr:phage tail protein [Acinetobacter baumannii]